MDRGLKTLQNLASNHSRVQAHHARRISANGSSNSADSYTFDDSLNQDDSGIAMGLDAVSRRSSGNVMPGWNQILQQQGHH